MKQHFRDGNAAFMLFLGYFFPFVCEIYRFLAIFVATILKMINLC